ncbi:DUF4390 domain-containing protein [Thermodesulfobacteriota bacterium]
MRNPVARLGAGIAAVAALLICAGAEATQPATISDLTVFPINGTCRVSFRVEGCFTEKVLEAIDSGFTMTMTFYIDVVQEKALWFNKKVVDMRIERTIKYLSAQDQYHIHFPNEDAMDMMIKEPEEAYRILSELHDLALPERSMVMEGKTSRLCVKARLYAATLPFYLDYLLFTTTLVEVDTDWKEIFLEDGSASVEPGGPEKLPDNEPKG